MTVDARAALRATGLLRAFNDAGILSAADVHVATRLGALGGEDDPQVLLAAALTVRGTRLGSVVLDLRTAAERTTPDADDTGEAAPEPVVAPDWPEVDDWVARCRRSPLVAGADGAGRPLRMVDGSLWLDRYWRQEQQVAGELLRRTADRPPGVDLELLRAGLARLFPGEDADDQRLAAAVCALTRVSVVAGGPGTGKTTTVARLLAVLHDQPEPPRRVALAAPTGKAAARLEQAVRSASGELPPLDRQRLGDLPASTLHRLLGRRPGSGSRFRHDRDNRLPHDVVVVDESSMVSLTLMARLLEALRPQARLVLVGDPHQLASVEAGAVLGDLVGPGPVRRTRELLDVLKQVAPHDAAAGAAAPDEPDGPLTRVREGVSRLHRVHRFAAGGPIAELAQAVRAGSAGAALAVLDSDDPAVELVEVADDTVPGRAELVGVRRDVEQTATAVLAACRAGDVPAALLALDRHRVLCAHRRGPRGVLHWAALGAQWWTAGQALDVRGDGRYVGQPLLVGSNDHEVGLYNGDTGVVVDGPDGPVAAFGRGGAPVVVPLARLGDVRPLYAMTVHRSQGSQFGRVTVLLPPAGSPLGTRETLYTAITRAESGVRLIGSRESVQASVGRPALRASGLQERLAAGA